MTGFAALAERVRRRRRRISAWWRRATVTGLGLRVVSWTTGCAGAVLAAPDTMRWVMLVVAVLFASAAVALPGTFWNAVLPVVSVAMLLAAGVVDGEGSILLAGAVGALLYLHHTTGAQASMWPSNARVEPMARRAWMVRTAVAVVSGLLVSAVLAVLVERPVWLPAPVQVVVGLVLVVAAVAGPVVLLRRRAD